MPVTNPDLSINLETHVFKEDESLLYVPIYNKATGMFGGLTKTLAHITLKADANERFYLYGYSKKMYLIVLHHEVSFTKHFSLHYL